MSIDMSQFYQVFYEESAEHLASMESLLLAIDIDSPDSDQLNAIFRAAHSIKGGSGTFGFADIAEVTHVLETLLDRIRKNEISITDEMVDVFLATGDVIHGLLQAHQNGTEADLALSLETAEKLKRLANGESGVSSKIVEEGIATSDQSPPPITKNKFLIKFAKTRSAFPKKAHLANLLNDLENLGSIQNKKIKSDKVILTLTTASSEADLQEILSFFLKPKQMTIAAIETQVSAAGAVADEESDADYGFFEPLQQQSVLSSENQPVETSEQEGYGFFVSTDAINSNVGDQQGYGFFVDSTEIKAGIESAQGFGFFEGAFDEAANTTPLNVSVTEENIPQRRATDKVVSGGVVEASIRVGVGKVDKMINLVGELVITQAMLAETVANMDPAQNERLIDGLAQLERNTRDLQDSVMSVRMMPISLVFSRFQRVVRDSASKLNKKIQLKIIGEGTELDKGLIEKVSDPLTHLVRNSLDHGIELPEERIAKGKDPQGTLVLQAAHQGGGIIIEVSDDGAGLDREMILAKAKDKGMSVSDGMSDSEVWQLIYAPGFSTASEITDVSGRGVGMDVVKKNIESIGGRVEVTSRKGLGCKVSIRLPLTLAILDGLSIAVGEQIYIIPLSFIVESLQPKEGDINSISGKQGQVVQVRGEYLPLIMLHQIFNISTRITEPKDGILVLLEAEGKKVALFVDELVGQHQVVIKSLETNYRKVPGISGATIMGDGRVAMIMDVGALVNLV
ncbi:MAG: chemotaxis protein CheW [Gallionella sp.]